MVVGILALQGGFALHQKKFNDLGIESRLVVRPEELTGIAGLVIPGGESSSIITNASDDLWQGIKEFSLNHPVWGTCAGAILLARRVKNPPQSSLGILDIAIKRNAYGSQNESFIATIPFMLAKEMSLNCIFIRAPKIVELSQSINVLATYKGTPVMVERNYHMATTFHPELNDGNELHEYFLKKIKNRSL